MRSALLFAFVLVAAGLFGIEGAIISVDVVLCSIILLNAAMPPVIIKATDKAFSFLF